MKISVTILSLQLCIIAVGQHSGFDSNSDGCIGSADLVSFLASFGNCLNSDTLTPCGQEYNYNGHSYNTIEFGNQCWFAENLRTETYRNGDSIPGNLSNDQWITTTNPAQSDYNGDDFFFSSYGRLYNWFTLNDTRGLCPQGWRVPSDEDWIILEMFLGMSEEDAYAIGDRGTNQGAHLRDPIGFAALPGGWRNAANGYLDHVGGNPYYWTSSELGPDAWYRYVGYQQIRRLTICKRNGHSVRCVRDEDG
jgi:uncharacterized protein (TIGR02145 family)